MKMMQQRRNVGEQALKLGKRDFADFAVFQRYAIAVILAAADRIHAEQFARHLKTGDLLYAVAVDALRLEMANLDRIQIPERVAGAKQQSVARHAAAAADDLF